MTGTAAVEFAIVLPLALLLYVGGAAMIDAVSTGRRLDVLTRTTADLASRQSTSQQLISFPAPPNAVTQPVLQQIMDGATALIDPSPEAPLSLTLSAVDVVALPLGICCLARVRWSFTKNGTLRPCNALLLSVDTSQITQLDGISSALLPLGTPLVAPFNLLIADATYAYRPIIQMRGLTFNPVMKRTYYMMPRSPGQVVATGLTAPKTGGSGGQVCY